MKFGTILMAMLVVFMGSMLAQGDDNLPIPAPDPTPTPTDPVPPREIPFPYDVGIDSDGITWNNYEALMNAAVAAGATAPAVDAAGKWVPGKYPGTYFWEGEPTMPPRVDPRDIRTHVSRLFPDGRVYVDEAGNVKVRSVTKIVDGRPKVAVKTGAGTGVWIDLAIIIGICVWDIWTDDPWSRLDSFGYPPEWDGDVNDPGFTLEQLEQQGVIVEVDDFPRRPVYYDFERPIPWEIFGVTTDYFPGGGGGDSAPAGYDLAGRTV